MASVVSRRAYEQAFFAAAALVLLALVVAGFAQSYFFAGFLLANLPSALVHVHASLFVGWLLLFIVQIALVTIGNVQWHRRLGATMAVWALLMVLVGPPTAVMAARRPHSGVGALQFLGDLGLIVVFAILVARALLLRRDSATHKRLMLLATATLILPALSRLDLTLPFLLGLYFLVPIALVAWDRTTIHRIHRATVFGLALMILLVVATLGISPTPMWAHVMRFVTSA